MTSGPTPWKPLTALSGPTTLAYRIRHEHKPFRPARVSSSLHKRRFGAAPHGRAYSSARGESGEQICQLLGLAGPQYGDQALSQWLDGHVSGVEELKALGVISTARTRRFPGTDLIG
jgi:hypothetical protein